MRENSRQLGSFTSKAASSRDTGSKVGDYGDEATKDEILERNASARGNSCEY